MNYEELVKEAKRAQQFAYAPYSKFKVGAALLTKSGKVYTGCNVENISFGATNCAERTAIFKAISEGENQFSAIAITSSAEKFTYPCGICRQVMVEFSPDMDVIIYDEQKGIQVHKISELIPFAILPLKI